MVAECDGPRVMGGASTNYHMVDVTYSGKKIDFAMFHGFTDGLGLNRFIEATLYHYFCLKDGCEYSDEGIVTSKVPYDPQEVATKLLSLPERSPQDTFFVDYVGGLRTNDCEDQVTEVRYLNADPTNGSFFVLMSETAGYFHTSVTHTFPSDRYYQAFCAVLDELGIPYEKQPSYSYLNPVVELPLEQRKG